MAAIEDEDLLATDRLRADILASNKGMRLVIEKSGLKAKGTIDSAVYELEIPLDG